MKELAGKVAVVTGAANGIGLALAERFAAEGLHVVMSDVEQGRLEEAAKGLSSDGSRIATRRCDVASASDVDALADWVYAEFGAVHVLCNNAGVLSGGYTWDTPVEDWNWVLGVNLYGIIHGLRSFVPRMEAQGSEGHIVNVASMAGVTTTPMTSVYTVSKHAALALSECLHKELAVTQSKLRTSVLCPEMIRTGIGEAERNRPKVLSTDEKSATRDMIVQATSDAAREGLPPSEMADRVVHAIREERFYILAEDDTWRAMSDQRCRDLIAGHDPSPLALPDGA
jgi:NAD(P)-dependent dehydrogenase (short-subunit alcohol dehydrogenase family)